MRKILFILILVYGCSKKDDNQVTTEKKCYRFTFSGSVGVPGCARSATLDTCIDPWVDISKLKFVDKCNNDLGWFAKEL